MSGRDEDALSQAMRRLGTLDGRIRALERRLGHTIDRLEHERGAAGRQSVELLQLLADTYELMVQTRLASDAASADIAKIGVRLRRLESAMYAANSQRGTTEPEPPDVDLRQRRHPTSPSELADLLTDLKNLRTSSREQTE